MGGTGSGAPSPGARQVAQQFSRVTFPCQHTHEQGDKHSHCHLDDLAWSIHCSDPCHRLFLPKHSDSVRPSFPRREAEPRSSRQGMGKRPGKRQLKQPGSSLRLCHRPSPLRTVVLFLKLPVADHPFAPSMIPPRKALMDGKQSRLLLQA